MLSKIRSRLTYPYVVSTLALFVALSTGGAYAANTVFSEDIVDGQVKTPDLANDAVSNSKLAGNAVGSQKVVDHSLTGVDVANGSLTGADIADESIDSDEVGKWSIRSDDLAGDSVGARNLKSASRTVQASESIPPNGGVGTATVSCPGDSQVMGAGASFDYPSGDLSKVTHTPLLVIASGQNNGRLAQNLTVKAYCLYP